VNNLALILVKLSNITVVIGTNRYMMLMVMVMMMVMMTVTV